MLPKKRAETWSVEETLCLINSRRKLDGCSKCSNKHLWDEISKRMRECGWKRSSSMCRDKWRNLIKEFKKSKNISKEIEFSRALPSGEVEEYFKGKKRNVISKDYGVDSHLQNYDKGIDEARFLFGSAEDSGRSTINCEQSLDPDGLLLSVLEAGRLVADGVAPLNSREAPTNGGENHSTYGGKVISVKCGGWTRRVGINGSFKAIKEAIRSTFGLRAERPFWLEDSDAIIRPLDRNMPVGNYTLHIDEGLTVQICLGEHPDSILCQTVDQTFYTEDDFRDFLRRYGWIALNDLRCNRNIDLVDDLHFGEVYHVVERQRR